jgi:lipoate-protein ligase B
MKIVDWGLIDYESSVMRQTALVDEVAAGAEECIVFCTHPPVVTMGRGTTPEDLAGWSGALVESSRGGRATYHGPNQLVIYPILDLKRAHREFKDHDVHAYLRALERATLQAIHMAGLPEAELRTSKVGETSLTGVWIGEHKIASIGIAVRKWVTYHGVAINITHDPLAFSGIRPCGFSPRVMTSLEQELGRAVNQASVHSVFRRVFKSILASAEEIAPVPERDATGHPTVPGHS